MTEDKLAPARKMLDSFMAGDLEGAVSAIHPECIVHEPEHVPYPGEFHGPQGFRDLVGVMMSVFEFSLLKYQLFDGGDLITMRAQIRVRSRTSGRTVDTDLVELYQVRDGLVADMDIFYKDCMEIQLLAKGE